MPRSWAKPCRSRRELPSSAWRRPNERDRLRRSTGWRHKPDKGGRNMASNGEIHPSYLYLGLAGETGRGRVVHSGLFRLVDGNDEWEPLLRGLPEMSEVRALAVHP